MADGDVDIPKIGPLPKKILIPLAVGLAGFVAWRYWQARNGTGADADSTITDGDFGAVDSSIPGVIGAVSPTNQYGSGDTGNTDNGSDPTRFTNNAQWTDYVAGKLQQSDTWSYSDIVTAIGLGLAGKPTTDAQQSILRAALAVGGQPPSGAIVIVSGGNTGITIAPTGVSASQITSTSASIAFGYVAGATSYQVFRNGVQVASGSGSPIMISGMTGGQTYSVTVAAVSASGTVGPQSGAITVKTPATVVGAISGRRTTTARTSIATVFNGATGAVRYQVALNGKHWNDVSGSPFTISGLKPNTRYSVTIRGIGSTGSLGPASTSNVTTKK